MADQNQNLQNSIPGTLRTLKTDLENLNSSPQDRLQQAGNFVQARPSTNSTQNITPTKIDSNIENKVSEKKDIPPLNSFVDNSAYSLSNMKSTEDVKLSNMQNLVKENTPKPVSDSKSNGFSVLDESLDILLNNNDNLNLVAKDSKEISPKLDILPKTENELGLNTASNQFDINSLNIQDDINNNKKSSIKGILSIVLIIILIILIGGGIYLFNISRNNNTNNISNSPAPTPSPTSSPIPTPTISPLFVNIKKLDISFVNTEPIRQTILSQLANETDSLIELNLTQNGNKVTIQDLADALTVTFPVEIIDNVEEYWLYGYNQQGIYKLTGVIKLKNDKNPETLINNWSTSIPRDLAGFSINSPSRIVNIPTIKQSSINNSSGKTFKNYYYNYTSPADSIDVSSYEKYLLMASSQDSMKYILNQIK